jgi:hypothetical protein
MTIALPETIGSLEQTPLAHLLVTALDRRATGTLVLEEPSGERHGLYFEAGLPRKVKTAEPVIHLGELLVQGGAISRPAYEATLARARASRRLHGQVLLAERLIEPYTLRSALSEQLCRQVTWLFARPSQTQFGFFDRENLLKDWGGTPESVRVNTMALIWRGVSEHLSTDRVYDIVNALGNARVALREDAPIDDFHFRGRARIIVDVLRGGSHQVEALMRSGLATPEEISRVLCALLLTRSLALGVPSLPPAGTDASEEAVHARRSAPWTFVFPLSGASVPGTEAPVTPRPPEDTPSPSQWPSPSLAPASVPNTWRELDAYWLAGEAPTPKVFAQTPFPEAARREDAESAPPRTLASGEGPPTFPEVEASSFPEVEASTYAPSGETATAFAEFIEEEVQASDEERWSDEFDLEALSSKPNPIADAGPETERFDGELDEAPPTVSEPPPASDPDPFAGTASLELSSAKEEGGPDTRFDPFELELEPPNDAAGATVASGTLHDEAEPLVPKSAAMHADDAERMLKRGEVAGAAREIARAVELDPNSGEHAALSAWIHVQGDTPDVPSILREVLRSTKLARDSTLAGWYRGLTLKRLDKHAAALREFRAIVDRDPLHVDAAREVRVYEMRLKRSPPGRPSLAPPVGEPPRRGLLRRFLPRGS